MSVRLFATVFGLVFLVAGAAGFVPGLSPLHAHPDLHVTAASRLALGLFPVNILHNLVHLAFGVWGLLAARSIAGSFGYARGVAVIYAVLTLLGLIPATNTLFGLVPLYGNDIWLHALLALVAGYFGFLHTEHDRADRILPR
ncbi:DUF4383 domain-containing protein [Sphingomonas sp. NPDC019816]|uniref:DUF4383 domain-containing protein n=1 Tax=unclassified Sphingomonas TaxID=196159 RepID=UPI0028995469|nr:DUF4383 domain-containing protein [Sphingomonas sp.]